MTSRYDTYHDTWVTIRYITIYCDTIHIAIYCDILYRIYRFVFLVELKIQLAMCHACHGSSNNMHVHLDNSMDIYMDFYHWFLWEQSFRSSFFLSKYRNTFFFSFCLVCPIMLSCLILQFTILLLFLIRKFYVFLLLWSCCRRLDSVRVCFCTWKLSEFFVILCISS